MENQSVLKDPKWVDIVFKVIVAIGVIANLYLSSNYVSKGDYVLDKAVLQKSMDDQGKHISEIEKTLVLISSQKSQIDDHEARLRDLEKSARK